MAKRGPKPTHEPTLAFERRRYITLVQVLALSDDGSAIKYLCNKWAVMPVEVCNTDGEYSMDVWATIQRLAQHAIEYHRNE